MKPTPLTAFRVGFENEVAALVSHGVRVVIVRPGIVYGEDGGLVGMMADQGKRDGVVRYVGTRPPAGRSCT